MHAPTPTHTHTHACTRKHACTCTCAHTRTHAHCWEKIASFRQTYCFLTFLPANSFHLMLLLTAPMDTINLQSCSPASPTPLLQKSKHQFPTTATSLIKASYSLKHITMTTFLSLKFVITLCWAKVTRLAMTICTWDLWELVWTRGRRQRWCKRQGKLRFEMKLYWIINWSIMHHQVSDSNCSTHLICNCIPLLVS